VGLDYFLDDVLGDEPRFDVGEDGSVAGERTWWFLSDEPIPPLPVVAFVVHGSEDGDERAAIVARDGRGGGEIAQDGWERVVASARFWQGDPRADEINGVVVVIRDERFTHLFNYPFSHIGPEDNKNTGGEDNAQHLYEPRAEARDWVPRIVRKYYVP
jgi:hypothetical protein